ncbi:hypothetical protein GRI38_05800 [Altererythrobacter aurantiacus]|uniref:Uncharacterized protein n=1 Tax=Parapontixanthobacter aurantiacus TaxID=1463599 RepID=A0A844ZIJ7_9SPHN|nr:hypothetical protein [Parapontixanthobacter aurantiacus]MXO85539.1 hypothetical protein [Parapontixanthobacter aurantiacus]
MSDNNDPTKPTSNDEKFKPQNVKGPLKDGNNATQHREQPGDTGGNDVPRGSSGQTKETPGA